MQHQMSPGMAKAFGKLVPRALQARTAGDGRPFVVAHFVTHKCNCKCPSCLWRHNDWDDVPLEDLKRFYRQAKEAGFVACAISGGEPLLRKDIGELVRFLKEELDFIILMFTTGWFVKKRAAEVMPYLDMLCLSLDSANRERHDEIRGLPGLYDRLMGAVDFVKAEYPALSVQFNTCVQKGIGEEVDDLVALAKAKGVRISFDVITEFRHGDDDHFTETGEGLPLEELQAVCGKLADLKAAGEPLVNSERYYRYFADGRPGYNCHFPKLAMSVDGRGNVEDCLNLDQPIANIRDKSVAEIFELPRFKELRKDAEKCCTCSSPTMVDMSQVWENPQLVFQTGGVSVS